MKKFILFASAIILCTGVFAQQKKVDDVAKFKDLTFDFGKIKQGTPVTHDFNFSNISSTPIVVEAATASCGCTTPVKPDAPVAAGKDSKITAGFNAANAGPFNKTITVKFAGADGVALLRIVGEVLTADAYAKYEADKKQPAKSGQ